MHIGRLRTLPLISKPTPKSRAATVEGKRENEPVFDACDLNPQRFINEVLNADDLLDGAFQFFPQQASIITGCGQKQSDELAKVQGFAMNTSQLRLAIHLENKGGVSYLRNMTQEILKENEDLQDLSVENLSLEGGYNAELDSHLNSLREKLVPVGKESSELYREIQALEKQACLNNSYDASLAEMLFLYEQNLMHKMFQDQKNKRDGTSDHWENELTK